MLLALVGCWSKWDFEEVMGCGVLPAFVGGPIFLVDVETMHGEGGAFPFPQLPVSVTYHHLWSIVAQEVY